MSLRFDDPPPKTDVAKQIKNGLKVGGILLLMIVVLYWCVREPVRRIFMHQPRFDAQAPHELPFVLTNIAAGNIDDNAWADLLVVTTSPAIRMLLYPGSAAGLNFEEPLEIANAVGALDFVVGDLDGDRLDEIIATPVGNQAAGFVIFWNLGRYQFERTPVTLPLRYVAVIDEDHDGHADIAGLTRNFEELHVHRLNGREVELEPAVSDDLFDNTTRDLEAAHLDGGGMDILLNTRNRLRLFRNGGLMPDITTYFNLPARTWRLEQGSNRVPAIALKDVNGDERPDLLYIDSLTVTLQLGLGGGDFTEAKFPVVSQATQRVLPADFNGDGNTDLLTVGADDRTVQILQGM